MRRTGRGKKSPFIRNTARDRIITLYGLAVDRAREGDTVLARRYTALARKVGMRYTVRIPRRLKRFTCKRCMSPLIPGLTARIRLRGGVEIITCLECGKMKRYPYYKKGTSSGVDNDG